MISYSHGLIKVLDRPQLESQSCECYSVVKRQTAMLLDYMPQRAVVTNTDDIPVGNPAYPTRVTPAPSQLDGLDVCMETYTSSFPVLLPKLSRWMPNLSSKPRYKFASGVWSGNCR